MIQAKEERGIREKEGEERGKREGGRGGRNEESKDNLRIWRKRRKR